MPMPESDTSPEYDAKSRRRIIRDIVKVRGVAGSLVISLPKFLLDPLELISGDYVMVTLDETDDNSNRRLILTKE
jgi:hypothetical protein